MKSSRDRGCPRPRQKALAFAVACLLVSTLSAGTAAAAETFPRFVPGRLLVRFRPGTAAQRALKLASSQANPAGPALPLLPESRRGTVAAAAREALARTARVRLESGETVEAAAARWSLRDDVEYAGPVHLIPIFPGASEADDPQSVRPAPATGRVATVPADPALDMQWQHDAIGSRQAWDLTAGDAAVVVGIIDTGVDYRHPDLLANAWSNAAEAAGLPGIDDDANGYIDDVVGYDFTDVPEVDGAGDFTGRDPDPLDEVGHGTWVAGVACATGNNGIGGAGVAWQSQFMVLRAGFRPRTGFSLGLLAEDDAAAAVVYAVDNGARVLNLSFGDQVRAPILEDAVKYAVDSDVLVVAAAGNTGNDVPFYPAGLPGVLAVGASDRDGRRASYSTWGPTVRLLAPGTAVYTTDLDSSYGPKSGTSLAAPVAAGAAALVRTLHPDWPASRVLGALLESARSPSSGADARGARFLDAAAAVRHETEATIVLPGLDNAAGFDDKVTIRGTVQGAGVRGWRVLARRSSSQPFATLAADPRGQAFDRLMATWDVSAEPEGPALIRVEALGIDRVVAYRDVPIAIDHSPPVISQLEVIPVLAGDHVGIRLAARSDDEVSGNLSVSGGLGLFTYQSLTTSRDPVLGLDGPLAGPGARLDVHAGFVNAAGLVTARDLQADLPDAPRTLPFRRSTAPAVENWLPTILDLDGDGRPELLGETLPEPGAIYGEVLAWGFPDSCTDCPGELLRPVWTSGARYIPRDAADFDGDGLPEILGLAVQEIRVYSRLVAGGFPAELRWSSHDAWPACFIPAPGGTGQDIVATRDTELRIYRRSGEDLELRQAIPNPTAGINSMSPFVIVLRSGEGGPLTLATIDGDGDLIVVERGLNGLFQPLWTRSLGADYRSELAGVDLDGDSMDEIVLVEAVGALPSPSSGLRDGFYRLHALRRAQAGTSYEEIPGPPLGAAGQFTGNPVSLSAARLSDGAEGIWWGVNANLYLVGWGAETPQFLGYWPDVPSGHPASGNLAGQTLDARPAAVFPGDAATLSAGSLIEPAPAGVTVPVNLGLRLAGSALRGGLVEAWLAWSDAAPPWTLTRRPGEGTGPADFVLTGLSEATFRDTTLVPGASYAYSVRSESGGPASALSLSARLENSVVRARARGQEAEIEWEHPIRASEQASLVVPDAHLSSLLIDRSGRRLLARFNEPFPPGSRVPFTIHGYATDPRFALAPPESAGVIDVEDSDSVLRLTAVRVVDAGRLSLVFDPEAPAEAGPDAFRFEPHLALATVSPGGGNTLEIRLDPGTPLHAGAYSIHVSPGVAAAGGAVVRSGDGDALSFSVDPVVYPNPARGGGPVRFDWLPAGAGVTVMDLRGDPVWSGAASPEGSLIWDLQGFGGPVAPGIYLFRIEGLETEVGKLAIVR